MVPAARGHPVTDPDLALEGRLFSRLLVRPLRNHRSAEGGEYVWLSCWPGDRIEREPGVRYTAPPEGDPDDMLQDDKYATWVGYEEDDLGLEYLLGTDRSEAALVSFLAGRGIAPGQPFCARFHSMRGGYGWDGEWDSESEADVVAVEPWTSEQVASAWQDWMNKGQVLWP